MYFSNSIIIHQVKTKKIITVKDVWIPDLNKHRFLRFYFSVYSLVFELIEKIHQTLETVYLSSAIQTPRISSKILHCIRVVFSTLFSVFGYPDETRSLMFGILHQNPRKKKIPDEAICSQRLSAYTIASWCTLTYTEFDCRTLLAMLQNFLTTTLPSIQFQKRPCLFVLKEVDCRFFVTLKAVYHLMRIGPLSHLAPGVGHL